VKALLAVALVGVGLLAGRLVGPADPSGDDPGDEAEPARL
jgi:hypothetical protein